MSDFQCAQPRRFHLLRIKIYRLVYWTIIPVFNPILIRISIWTRPEPDNEMSRFWYGIHEIAWGLVCGSRISECLKLAWIWWRPKSWDGDAR